MQRQVLWRYLLSANATRTQRPLLVGSEVLRVVSDVRVDMRSRGGDSRVSCFPIVTA